jgi:hypothetical protein
MKIKKTVEKGGDKKIEIKGAKKEIKVSVKKSPAKMKKG